MEAGELVHVQSLQQRLTPPPWSASGLCVHLPTFGPIPLLCSLRLNL